MRKFIFNISFFLFLWIALLTVLMAASHLWVKRNLFTNANQEGNLLIMPNGVGYDYLVLGISHGRGIYHVAATMLYLNPYFLPL